MILKLKGIGKYTAADIASIAFGLPCAAVDGNVYRVVSRIFEIETPIDQSKWKIWQNLDQFPLIETLKSLTMDELRDHTLFKKYFSHKKVTIEAISPEIIHQLTHQKLHVIFIEIKLGEPIQWSGAMAIPNIELPN